MALEPLGQTTKEGKVREDFLHRLFKYFLFPCFILIRTCKFYVCYTRKSINVLQSQLPNTYLWETTHPMIFQELSHSLLVKLNAFISKVRLMHLLLNTS